MTEFETKREELFKQLGEAKIMVLSTAAKERVSSRMMSLIIMDGKFYFQTDRRFRKYEQLCKNPHVALCAENVQIEGICTEIGIPTENKEFGVLFEKHFKSSYDAYYRLEDERLFVIEPDYIERWIYEAKEPFIETYDFASGTYEKKAYIYK